MVPVSRPAVSQHLKVLEDAGLVLIDRADGTRRLYQLDPYPGSRAVRAYFDTLWNHALTAFKAKRSRNKGGRR